MASTCEYGPCFRCACWKCEGDGKVADSTDQEPWSAWSSLPPGSDIAVRLGIVKPIDCPVCGGSGEPQPMTRSTQ